MTDTLDRVRDHYRATDLTERLKTAPGIYAGPSAQAWFAGGERVGYDLKARAIVAAQDAPLRILLRREGDVAHAVTFLPGFPDGSFGWAKVLPYLPNAIVGLERTTKSGGRDRIDHPRGCHDDVGQVQAQD